MASFVELVRAGFYAMQARVAARDTINPAVVAAGSTQATATAVQEGYNVVTGADGTKGVVLPPAEPGMRVVVKNATAAVLKIYPNTGGVINTLAANAALSTAASLVPVEMTAIDGVTWYTNPLVPS